MLLPLNKASGLYSILTHILKSARHIISKPLADIIHISIIMGKYPSKFKQAKVIPVFKSEDPTGPSNYRPISLLSVFNRIFEKLMYKRLKSFIDSNGILFSGQYVTLHGKTVNKVNARARHVSMLKQKERDSTR